MPDFPSTAGASASAIWSYATREITRITGSARQDVVGQDNTLEVTSGSRMVKMDNMDATVSTRAVESGGRLSTIPAFTTPTEASITMTGSEQTLIEITDVKSSEVEAWVDLTPMQSGDTIVVKYYRKMKSGGTYAIYANETYSNAQSIPALCIMSKKVYRDTKVTAQQTATGSYRTLDVQMVRAREA